MFSEELVASVVKELQIADLAHATIGEVLLVASRLEQQTGDSIHPNGIKVRRGCLPIVSAWKRRRPL